VGNSGCRSLVCRQQKCEAPSCDDYAQNGDETGLDCGGSCKGCGTGIACATNADCTSSVCTSSVCQAARCDDGVKNGSESDRDCGAGCAGCALDRSCISHDDCASKSCAGTCVSSLHVDLICSDRSPSSGSPRPYFRIVNDGKQPFPLSSLSLRYFYSKEAAGPEEYRCYSVIAGDCTQLGSTFGDVKPKTSTADRYLQLQFSKTAPALAVNQTLEIQGTFFIAGYPAFAQTNDYSFSSKDGFQLTPRVTLYADGVLIWGSEP